MSKKLSTQRICFCEEFIVDFNMTAAAKRAKYSEKTAYSIGSRLLKNVEVQNYIKELLEKRSKRTEITADWVLTELYNHAIADLADYFTICEDTGAIQAKSFDAMPEGKSHLLKSIKEDRAIKEDAQGDKVTVYDKIQFSLHDKLKALELIGRHLGMFTDKSEVDLKNTLFRIIYDGNGNGHPK